MWYSFVLTPQKSEALDPPPVYFSALRCVNPRCIHTAVAEDIRKAHDILLNRIKGSGKQMTQVMRKDLLLVHAGAPAQPFHIAPYIGPVKRIPVFRHENRAAFPFLFPQIPTEHPAKRVRQKHRAAFPFAPNLRPAAANGFRRDRPQLRHSDSRRADRAHQEIQPLVVFPPGSLQKPFIFRLGKLPFLFREDLPLHLQGPNSQLRSSVIRKEAVQ